MDGALISTIVPVYNARSTIRKCIDSILGQTYSNMEIILVDDGSTDGSLDICNEYMARDSRIKVIHKDNGGVSSARNTGLSAAAGDYIAFVDADDYLEKEMYGSLIGRIMEDSSDIAICNLYYEDPQGNILHAFSHADFTFDKSSYPEYSYFIPSIAGYVWNRLYSRNVIWYEPDRHVAFDPEITIAEDGLFGYEIFNNNPSVRYSYIDSRLYHYVVNPESAVNRRFDLDKLSYFDAIGKEIEMLDDEGLNNDYLKADYVINSIRVGIIMELLKITGNTKYGSIREHADSYKKQIRYRHFPPKLKIKYLVATKMKFAYRYKIIHDRRFI
ncbi:MAG: glycosyltransferase [Oscillospiraceae bacterium]|nr:glycosyltransferase [Oscillospiraceae bacterium]